MSLRAKRGVAAAVTVVIAAAVNVATGMLTQSWAARWWAATVVLVIVGIAAQVWLTVGDNGGGAGRGEERASGGSVTITGDVSGIVSTGDSSTNTQTR